MRHTLDRMKKLFFVSRPISWLNTAYPFAAAYLVLGGHIDARFILGTLYFLGPYNLLLYGINDVFDYESDIQNPRKGGIEGMREARSLHPTILWGSLITNVPFLVVLCALGTVASNSVLVGLVFFVIAYSIKGLRFKEIPLLDSITSSFHFIGPFVFALSYLPHAFIAALPLLVSFFLWGIASHALGAIQDIIPDRAGGLHSIATFFGARRTIWFVFVLYVCALFILLLQARGGDLIIAVAGISYVINIMPSLNVRDETSVTVHTAWRRFLFINLGVGMIVTFVLLATHLF